MSEYRNVDVDDFYERHYDQVFKHQSAMTGEDLHSKIDIAVELAHRDVQIESLMRQLKAEQKAHQELRNICADIDPEFAKDNGIIDD